MEREQDTSTKQCSKCKTVKPLGEFSKAKHCRDGRRGECRMCNNAYGRAWHTANLDRSRANKKAWVAKNPRKARDSSNAWRAANPEKVMAAGRARYATNSDAGRASSARWSAANPDRVRELNRNRSRADPVTNCVRAGIHKAKAGGFSGAIRHLPYTVAELGAHLRSTLPDGVTWGDYMSGAVDLHIDHIRPVSSWPLAYRQTPESVAVIWALSNLQLLHAADNLRKSAKWDGNAVAV